MPSQFSQTTRSLAHDTSRGSQLAWLLSGFLLATWLVWFFGGGVTIYEVSRNARLEVRLASHHVASVIPAIVVSNRLAIGAEVSAGDVLVELDARAERLRLAEEEARLASFPPMIASLQDEIRARQSARDSDMAAAVAAAQSARHRNEESVVAVEFAKETEKRLARLATGGSVSLVESSKATAEVLKLTATREATLAEMRRTELDAQGRGFQSEAQIEALRRSIVSIEGDMATTKAAIGRLKIEVEKHRVRAPVSGRIGDAIALPAGAYVDEGQRLATVVPTGDIVLVAEFSPSLTLGRVREGQAGRLRLDAYPWTQYGALGVEVAQVATEVRDNLVRVEFVLTPEAVRSGIVQHGLPGAVEVAVERVSPAVLVMRAAGLLFGGEARMSGQRK